MNKKPTYWRWLIAMTMIIFLWSGTSVNAQQVTRDIGASTVTTSTATYTPGATNVVLSFLTTATSPDLEFVLNASLDFPAGVAVVSATSMLPLGGGPLWNGEIGDGVTTTWGDGSDYLYNEVAPFTVTVNIAPTFSGDMDIDWLLEGDTWGSLPHTASGTMTIAEVSSSPGLEILTPNLAMGYRPIGAWMEPARFEIVNNPGTGDLSITTADIDNNYGGFVEVVAPTLPYTLASGATTTAFGLTANVEATAVAGPFTGQYAVIYGANRALATATYDGMAYVPILGDVVENAFLLPPTVLPTPAPLPLPSSRESGGWYKNYILPNDLGNSLTENDVVFEIAPTEDMLLNLTPLYGSPVNFAVYAEGFEGEGGPMATNAMVQAIDNLVDVELFAGNTYYLVGSSLLDWDATYTLLPMPAPDPVTYVAPLDGAININNAMSLSWTFGNNVSEYEVVLGTTYPPTTVVVPYTSTLATSYTLAGLQPNMQYFWQVNVKNTQGETEGPVWGFTTTIDVPTGLTVALVDPAPTATTVSANLNWTGPSDRAFIGYNVYRNGVKLNTAPLTASEYQDLGLARNTTYAYRVTNVYDEGESAQSAAVTVTTKGVGIFNGFVYDFLTNDPIEGARVDIAGTAGNYSVLTAANGAYSTQAYRGTYSITASATDYTSQTLTSVLLDHAATVSNSFYLKEVPYPVTEVVAVELNDNSVQISWSGSRGIVSYDVWREKVYQPGTLELIGNTVQEDFVDFDWGIQDWGVYRWAVTVNYDAAQVSAPTYSNTLDKDMYTMVDVTVALNSADSPAGTQVTFTNTSEPTLELVYDETLGGSGVFTWDMFRKGTYDIDVFKAGYSPVSMSNVDIFDEASFEWLLIEILAPPTDLYVTPTGFATWQGGIGTPFEPFMENFDALAVGSIPEGWSRSPEVTNWAVHSGTQAGGTANQMRFYFSPFATNDFYLKTPVMSTTGQSSLQLSFRNMVDEYTGPNTLKIIAIADGVEYVIDQWVNEVANRPASMLVYDLTSAHGVGAAEFQIAWVYSGYTLNIDYWYIDDVSLMGAAKAPKSFQTYKVFHDGVLVAETGESMYQYGTNGEALVDGETYLAEVATVYSTGQSPRASYTWTYIACDNYATPGNFAGAQVEGTLDVNLTWTIPTIPVGEDQIDFARISRDGEVITETDAAMYLDEDLDIGTYEYCITFVYESGAETCPATICTTVDVTGGGLVNGNVSQAAYLGGDGIEGAVLTLTNVATPSISFTFTTDADGDYDGEVLAGTYNYSVVAEGYITATLAAVAIPQSSTVTRDFELMEFPAPVELVVATELSDNAVQVTWRTPGTILFEPTTVNFDAGIPSDWTVVSGGNTADTWEGVTNFGGSTLDGTPFVFVDSDGAGTAATLDEMLVSPVFNVLGTSQLFLQFDQYYRHLGTGTYGQVDVYDGTAWVTVLNQVATAGAWGAPNHQSIDVTAYANPEFQVRFHYFDNISWAWYWAVDNVTITDEAPLRSVMAPPVSTLAGYNVYRTTCVEGGDLQFLGYTLDTLFNDNTWVTAESGTYKWAVEAVYAENESEVRFSNCLDKDMITQVSVTVITNSGDSPEETDVMLTNISEPELGLVYDVELDATGYFMWEEFRKGTYDVYVEKNGFAPIMETVEIDGPTNLSYILEELLAPVSDLHVSPTGFATWRPGGIIPFEGTSFDFEADAQGWDIQGNVNGWRWGNNASLSSTFMNFNGNSTNFIAASGDAAGSGGSPIVAMAKSPMMMLSTADEVYLSFDYKLTTDALTVHYSIAEGAPVLIETLAAASAWTTHTIMLPEEALADDVQIIFLYTEASTWGYGAGVDNVVVTDEAPENRALEYYKVWLDGIFVTDTPETFYQYDPANLVPGQEYFSEVAAVYSNGISAKMDYTWTYYPCDSFPGPDDLTYEVVDVNDVVLNWGGNTPPPPPGGDFFEDFEAGTLPTGWMSYDVDNDGYKWDNSAVEFSIFDAHAGLYCMASASYRNDVGALTPNNWLVTPAIAVTATSQLKFWVDAQDPLYAGEQYYVKVSTTGNAVADFTTTIHTAVPAGDWSEVVKDLSAYAGQTIYIAFQHANVTDMFFLKLDDVTVTNTATRAAQTSPLAAAVSHAVSFKTQGMSQSEIDARIQTSRVLSVVETATTSGNTAIINGTGKSLSENRAVLFNNGPLVNSAGTAVGGADESILQSALGMTSYGSNVNNGAGYHMADDFVVDANWAVESFEFFAYQTGSTTTSTLTGAYFQIYNGAPNAGGTVVYGDLTTNRMSSTSWSNIYRNNDGPGGSTNRPVMKAVCNVTDLTLEPGTYWVEYTLTGSLASGPWTAPITINGQTTTGNALQWNGTAWAPLQDGGTFTNQGVPIIINGTVEGGGGGGSTTFDPGEFLGANVYRDGELIAEMVQGETYTDMDVEPGYYDYCVTFVYAEGAMSCLSTCVLDVLVTEDCEVPQNLTATGVEENNEVTLVWNENVAVEFRYDDGVSTGQLGSSGGTLNTVLGAKHTSSAELTEMSWYTTAEGGPHTNIQIYVFGLTSAGLPNGNDVLYTASVTNTDDTWNTHTFPTPITADGGFFIGIAYNGFAAIGTDDGVGAPYVFQPNTHYFVGDYTAGGWETWETYAFNVNGMIRAIGVEGAKASYAVAPTVAPVEGTKERMTMVYTSNEPVATGAPQWSTPARDRNRAFLGYNIYRDGSLLEALWPETTYVYLEGAAGVTCYTVTAEYEFCGETEPSNEACVDFITGVNPTDLSEIKVYPNPSNSTVNIELTNNVSQVVIYNYLGQVVMERNITDETILNVNVRNYEAGAYLVKFVTSEGNSLTKKVVVTK